MRWILTRVAVTVTRPGRAPDPSHGALGKVTDGLVVLAVVVLNSLIGFVQEYRASRTIEALRGMVPENAAAIRDGRRTTVPAALGVSLPALG